MRLLPLLPVSAVRGPIHLLDEAEALELVEFDPSVEPKDTWNPPLSMVNFLEKHFNRTLDEGEREAILKDFPKPHCKAIVAPRTQEDRLVPHQPQTKITGLRGEQREGNRPWLP